VAEVVVLAGGRGTRLAPYTTVFPKPLMPIGGMPVLEILLRRLVAARLTEIHLAVGHLAELIEAFFGDGARFGANLTYWREDEPRGTAGALAQINTTADQLLVMNGDLLTALDFRALLTAHGDSGAAATIGVHRRTVPIDFGVVRTADGRVVGFEEKQELSYEVSMGVYVLERRFTSLVPTDGAFDFPDLIHGLLGRGEIVRAYESDAFWLDIGRAEDYQLANERFSDLRPELFGEL
jgi:NDP-mannose synthase